MNDKHRGGLSAMLLALAMGMNLDHTLMYPTVKIPNLPPKIVDENVKMARKKRRIINKKSKKDRNSARVQAMELLKIRRRISKSNP